MDRTNGVLVVTGASRGIGAATARRAAARGWRVCVNYRTDAAAAERVVAAIRDDGGDAFEVRADTADEAAVIAMFDTVAERYGRIDALVANAGTYGTARRVADLPVAEMRQMLETNVLGLMICAREAVRRMSTRSGGAGGRIVTVSSVAGMNGGSGQRTHYAASKGAVNAFTLGLAKEVAGEGINVNTVSPGLTWTDMNPPGRLEAIEHTVPIGRAAQPEEIAAGIVWLLSDEASYCVGANLTMSGGR
ncbi:SDR family oxidoreductase [Acuticoccus sp. M5D2P5]|uniref:SDR family oxidoreductase n=1 Tax=Acuticoccus kalidii TaxID=2910977 RepID=UPI001F387717|nr:SDR family oxidoreductase [Acuticoccus kalidii]MCF3933733.1 SDR family oxidoreductase [Acuticoccus kalidii]